MSYARSNLLKGFSIAAFTAISERFRMSESAETRILEVIDFKRPSYPESIQRFKYNISSNKTGSLFKPGAYNPNQEVTVVTSLKINGIPLEITLPMREFMISFNDLNGMAKEAKRRMTSNAERRIELAKRGERLSEDSTSSFGLKQKSSAELTWELSNGFPDIGKMFDYRGFGLIAKPKKRKTIFGTVTPTGEIKTPIQGKVSIVLPDGTDLGQINYYWINPSTGSRLTSSRTSQFTSDEGQISQSAIDRAKRERNEMYSPLWKSRRFKAAGLESFTDLFSALWNNPGVGKTAVNAVGLIKGIQPQFKYLPKKSRDQIDEYYNLRNPGSLVDDGWDPAAAEAEVIQRATLRAKFPLSEMKQEWIRWLVKRGEHIDQVVSTHAPHSKGKIFELIARSPLGQGFAFKEIELRSMIDILKAKNGGILTESVLNQFKATLSRAMTVIENVELQVFNYDFFTYVTIGMVPAIMVNTTVTALNRRRKKAAERAKKAGLLTNIITLVVSAIPVVGVSFSVAIQLANAKTNIDAIKLQKSEIKKEEAAVGRELTAATQEILKFEEQQQEILVAKQEDLVEKKIKRNKTLKKVGFGAAATVALAAGINSLI